MNKTSLTILITILGLSAGASHAGITLYAVANQAVAGGTGQQSFTDVHNTPGLTPPSNYGSDGFGGGYLTTYDPAAPQGIFTRQISGTATGQPFLFSNLTPNAVYTEQIDLAEDYFSAGDDRTFGLTINGTSVLPKTFSIATAAYAQYGPQPGYDNGTHEAISESFTIAADSSGKISLLFVPANNQTLIGGIEIIQPSASPAPEASQVNVMGLIVLGLGGLLLRARRRFADSAVSA